MTIYARRVNTAFSRFLDAGYSVPASFMGVGYPSLPTSRAIASAPAECFKGAIAGGSGLTLRAVGSCRQVRAPELLLQVPAHAPPRRTGAVPPEAAPSSVD